MTDITSALAKIQIEETQNKAAVSEATMTKIGGSLNAIIDDFAGVPLTDSGVMVPDTSFTFTNPSSSDVEVQRFYTLVDIDIKGIVASGEFYGTQTTGGGNKYSYTVVIDALKNGLTSILDTTATVSGVDLTTSPVRKQFSFTADNVDSYSNNLSIDPVLSSGITLAAGEYIEFRVTNSATSNSTGSKTLSTRFMNISIQYSKIVTP